MDNALQLSELDRERLKGQHGEAQQFAMQLLERVAKCTSATRFIDIQQAHLVGSYYGGPADFKLIKQLADKKAQVVIPTTLNASACDIQHPHLFKDDADAKANCELVKLYQSMGCRVELTCAPYYLPTTPNFGDNIAWAESNAIAYANSVIGARSNKTFQYLDLCAALTGRMPEYGLYLTENRKATILIKLKDIPEHWHSIDAFYQLLGYQLGKLCGQSIPVIEGLSAVCSKDNLRSIGAAAASSGSLEMFHAVGLTPEAETIEQALQNQPPQKTFVISSRDIQQAKHALSHPKQETLTAVCLGTPHFSYDEFQHVLALLGGNKIASNITLYISTGRHVYQTLLQSGELDRLKAAGITIVTDACTYYGSLFKNKPGSFMTSSVKWAYYAPGNLNIRVQFASTQECITSALAGKIMIDQRLWQVE